MHPIPEPDSQLSSNALSSLSLIDEKTIIKGNWIAALELRKKALADISSRYSAEAQLPTTFESLENRITPLPSARLQIWQTNLKNEIISAMKVLEATTNLFIRALQPSAPSLDFFLGVLLRVIKMTQEAQKDWQEFVETFDDIRLCLEKLNDSALRINNDRESNAQYRLAETVSRVLLLMIDLWIEVIGTVKSNPKRSSRDTSLHVKSEHYVDKIKNSISHCCDLLASKSLLENREGQVSRQMHNEISNISDGDIFPLKVLPYPAYHGFFGREDILSRLNTELGLTDFEQRSHQLKSVLLHGLGGVGKSQTARAYAHSNLSKFDAIFWIRSDNDVNIKTSFTDIALALKLPGAKPGGNDDESWIYFTRWLDKQAADEHGKRWLMIFDNCDSIEDIYPKYIPKTKGSVLITSRYDYVKLPDSVVLPIRPFSEEEGIKLMKRLLEPRLITTEALTSSEEKSLRSLLESVDGLPLAIQVLVALMLPRIPTVSSFYKFYKENSRTLMTKIGREADYDRDLLRKPGESHILDNVFFMSFATLNQNAISVLGMLSFIAPHDISISWFDLRSDENTEVQKTLSICRDPVELDEVVVKLQQAALINREDFRSQETQDYIDVNHADALPSPSGSSHSSSDSDLEDYLSTLPDRIFSIHRLVQDAIIYSRTPSERQEIFDAAVHVMLLAFPKQTHGETLDASRNICNRLAPHVIALAERFQALSGQSHQSPKSTVQHNLRPSEELASLLKSTIWYLYENGNGKAALRLLSIAYNVYLDKTTETYADLQFKAGGIYLDRNELEKCRQAWEEARTIYEERSEQGSKTAIAAISWVVHSLGNLESACGNLEKAFLLYEQADSMRKAEGPLVPWREALANMTSGRAYFLKGNNNEALSRFDKAEATFRNDSTWMAYLKYAYGNVELSKSNYEAARRYYYESIDCWKLSSEFHLGLSACYYKLGCLELLENKLLEALEHLKKASKIAKHQGNGDQARIDRKRAEVLKASGQEKDAEHYSQQAEALRLKIPGQGKAGFSNTEASWDSLVCIFWR